MDKSDSFSPPPSSGSAEQLFALEEPGKGGSPPGKSGVLGPLILVPAGIVLAGAALFFSMSWLMSDRQGPEEYLHEVISGGYNARKQGFFSLMQAISDYQRRGKLDELPADFDDDAAAAFDRTEPDDAMVRLALCFTLTALKSDLAQQRVIRMIEEAAAAPSGVAPQTPMERVGVVDVQHLDPLTWGILFCGDLGDPRSLPTLTKLASSPDPGVRSAVGAALGNIRDAGAGPLLRVALLDGEPSVRFNAAVSLAKHGDAAGAGVLIGMLDPTAYRDTADRGTDGTRPWDPDQREQAMLYALGALQVLRFSAARPQVEVLARLKDMGPRVQNAAMKWLEDVGTDRDGR